VVRRYKTPRVSFGHQPRHQSGANQNLRHARQLVVRCRIQIRPNVPRLQNVQQRSNMPRVSYAQQPRHQAGANPLRYVRQLRRPLSYSNNPTTAAATQPLRAATQLLEGAFASLCDVFFPHIVQGRRDVAAATNSSSFYYLFIY